MGREISLGIETGCGVRRIGDGDGFVEGDGFGDGDGFGVGVGSGI